MADAKWDGLDSALARFDRLPGLVQDAARHQLASEAQGMAEAFARAAPVSEHDQHPGQLKEDISVGQVGPDGKRALNVRILSFARDAAGRLYGAFVEFGHGAAGPRPWWWPTYRARRKQMRSRMSRAVLKAIRTLFPKVT